MMDVVILAGGLGERLKPFTEVLPKPLLPLGENSIIEVIISKLKKQGFTNFTLAVGYKPELIKNALGTGENLGVKITYSEEKMKLGTAGPLKLIKDKISDNFLSTNGDIITNLDFNDLTKFHNDNKADITVVTKKVNLPLAYGVIKSDEESNLVSFEEKPNISAIICAGIYVINKKLLDLIPADTRYDMPELIRTAKEKGFIVKSYECKEYWLDMGKIEDYNKAKQDLSEGIKF